MAASAGVLGAGPLEELQCTADQPSCRRGDDQQRNDRLEVERGDIRESCDTLF